MEWLLDIPPAEPGQGTSWRYRSEFPWPDWVLLLFAVWRLHGAGWQHFAPVGALAHLVGYRLGDDAPAVADLPAAAKAEPVEELEVADVDGVLALREHFNEALSERERQEREDWAFEVALLMRNRFLAYEVYEEWFEGTMSREHWRKFITAAPGSESAVTNT